MSILSVANFFSVKASPSFEVNIFYPEAVYNTGALGQLESSLGEKFNAAMWYLDWSDDFTSQVARGFQGHGTTPTLVWQPQVNGAGVEYSQVTNGSYDRYLNSFADSVKSLGFPVRISLAPEMNAEWEPWGVGNAGDASGFRAFWQHTVNTFRSRGANNVQWIWAPNIHFWGERSSYADLYPGDDWVDFTGLDGYNWGTSQSWSSWQSFSDIFGSSYNDLVNLSGKNILITELASTESGGNKAQWITEMFNDIPSRFSRIAGIYWFNINKETDWRINSSEGSLNAFRAGLSGSSGILNIPGPVVEETTFESSQQDSPQNNTQPNSSSGAVKTDETPTGNPSIAPLHFKPEKFKSSLLPLAKTTFYNQKTAQTIPGKVLGTVISIDSNGWRLDNFISLQTQVLVISLIAMVSLISFITLALRF